MVGFVIDASYAAAWCFEDEATSATEAALDECEAHGAFVPSLWKFEIANLLRSAERRGRISEEDADRRILALSDLVIVDHETSVATCWRDIVPIARAHTLTIYDASYVELALRLKLPLATRDKAMMEAARALKIEVVVA